MKYAQKKEYIFIREKRFYSTTHDTIRANYETILSLLSLESSKILSTTIIVHVLACFRWTRVAEYLGVVAEKIIAKLIM